jgi:hypothetical protein
MTLLLLLNGPRYSPPSGAYIPDEIFDRPKRRPRLIQPAWQLKKEPKPEPVKAAVPRIPRQVVAVQKQLAPKLERWKVAAIVDALDIQPDTDLSATSTVLNNLQLALRALAAKQVQDAALRQAVAEAVRLRQRQQLRELILAAAARQEEEDLMLCLLI